MLNPLAELFFNELIFRLRLRSVWQSQWVESNCDSVYYIL